MNERIYFNLGKSNWSKKSWSIKEKSLLTNGKGMHNQVLSGSTPSIFLPQVLPLRCDTQGWPQNKKFFSQFRRKKKRGIFEFFKSVFIRHQNKTTVFPKPSHVRPREEREVEAKQQMG